jgi:hypothetical protein
MPGAESLMCMPKAPKMPKVIERDPIKEAADAANVSQGKANAEIALRRKKLRGGSLYTGAGMVSNPYAAAYAATKPTLGGM